MYQPKISAPAEGKGTDKQGLDRSSGVHFDMFKTPVKTPSAATPCQQAHCAAITIFNSATAAEIE
jgi:hypothetical protein